MAPRYADCACMAGRLVFERLPIGSQGGAVGGHSSRHGWQSTIRRATASLAFCLFVCLSVCLSASLPFPTAVSYNPQRNLGKWVPDVEITVAGGAMKTGLGTGRETPATVVARVLLQGPPAIPHRVAYLNS